jgi:hypothetical protein
MKEEEYAADLKQAIVNSPRGLTDEWYYTSHGIYLELVPLEGHEDSPIEIFPGEQVAFEDTLIMGWMQRVPVADNQREQNPAHKEAISAELRNAAMGLTDILSVLKRREEEHLTVPTVLLGMNLDKDQAKFAQRRLGFYYLGNLPGSYPFSDTFDMAVATETLKRNFNSLKNKPLAGRPLFERLRERRERDNRNDS